MVPIPAREYDDGNDAIPGGICEPVERVIVVGAGISGLTVASALTTAGVECLVLEARDRIGGRLHTVDQGTTPIDLGGSWIHHPVGNPLRRFVTEQGLLAPPGDPLPTIGGFDAVEARRLTRPEVEQCLELFEQFAEALDDLRDVLPVDATAADGIEAFVAASSLTGQQERLARQGLRAVVEADAADGAEHQSLRWLWNEIEYEGDLFGDLPSGGYRSVVEAMAAGLDIRRDAAVEAIDVDEGAVLVTTADGACETGSHVVVTVPLGILKSGTVRFSPTLPAWKSRAIDELGFGHYEKVALTFERAFWREAGLSHLMYFPQAKAEPATWIFDLDAFGSGPVLVAHVFDGAAHHVLDADERAAVNWAVSMVTDALGTPCPEPVATTVTRWAFEPYSRGSYTHVPPGATPALLDVLAEPAHGRVLFAGEHTYAPRMGYADGAMSSGVREAKRLLGRRSVKLDGFSTGGGTSQR